MAQEFGNKIKLLKLIEMLRQDSNEQHPLMAYQICKRLEDQGISCDRRTLTRDIRVLEKFGYEVMSTMVSHEKAYYIEDRSFSIPEIKILIDAVQAASFITDRKTGELIDKLAELGGSHRGEILKSNIVTFNTRKHQNESIYYSVGYLEEAIEQNKKVIFRYFDLNENGDRAFRKDGHHYVVEPIALVFNEDNYYLVTYSSRHDSTANYRVDRMDGVEVIDETICDKAMKLRKTVAGITEQTFKMYAGETVDVMLQFDNDLIGSVYDKFGEDTKMLRVNDKKCAASVKVQISPTFWGWLFQFGEKMTILSPGDVAESYRKQIEAMIQE